MNIIYKIFYMLVGRSIESELRTNKIVKLRYDFINERKRDILFLLYFSLINAPSSEYDNFSNKNLIRLNKIDKKIDELRQYLIEFSKYSLKNKGRNYLFNIICNFSFLLIVNTLFITSDVSLVNSLLPLLGCTILSVSKSMIDTQKYKYECSDDYLDVIESLLFDLDVLKRNVNEYIEARTAIKYEDITLEKIINFASSFDVEFELSDLSKSRLDINESSENTLGKSSGSTTLNKTDDEEITVEEVEVNREVGEKRKSKVRKRKR